MKNAQEKHITVARTARYFQLGEAGPKIRRIWYVLHGYGQLAAYFVQHFQGVADETTLVIAPEALSRFYNDGLAGRVGATWMTKEDRLAEIEDYVAYLDALHASIQEQVTGDPEITLLGFSQGTATAWRWMKNGRIRPHHLVNWAGGVPHEMTQDWATRLRELHLYMVLGDQDQFIKPASAEKQIAALRHLKPDLEYLPFAGEHRIDAPTMKKLHASILSKKRPSQT